MYQIYRDMLNAKAGAFFRNGLSLNQIDHMTHNTWTLRARQQPTQPSHPMTPATKSRQAMSSKPATLVSQPSYTKHPTLQFCN